MIFDEATSALDTKTEKEIQHALHEVAKGRTTLVIAHRLSTIIEADEILVLKAGVIHERGTHFDLLEKQGEYYSMWVQQTQDSEAGDPKNNPSKLAQVEDLILS
jgi:ATP-binding cassette subfamily B protein